MSFTPFQAPLLAGLFGDREIASCFSVQSELDAFAAFETGLAKAQSANGLIPVDAADAITRCCKMFKPDMDALSRAVERDGVPIPEYVRQLRRQIGEPHAEYCHFGATSQDVIDTALVLRLRTVLEVFSSRLDQLAGQFDRLEERYGRNMLMARTRMQAALPMTVADRIARWRTPLRDMAGRLEQLVPGLIRLQLGGPVGDRRQMGEKAAQIAEALARELGVAYADAAWHTERTSLLDFAGWMAQTSKVLGKLGLDTTLMAQLEIGEIRFSGAGRSSAMAHKRNPVLAESLVTLAAFTANLAGGMLHAQPHEMERSGIAWSLEWLLLPQLCVATGAAMRNSLALLESVEHLGTPANEK